MRLPSVNLDVGDFQLFWFKEQGGGVVDCSDKLYSALMKHVQESHAKLKQNIQEELRRSEQKDAETMTELREEVSTLQEMNSRLKELSQSEDHLHLLQVSQHPPVVAVGFYSRRKTPLGWINKIVQVKCDAEPSSSMSLRTLDFAGSETPDLQQKLG